MQALLGEASGEKRSFLWAHYLEPHDAYVRHEGFPPSNTPGRGLYDGEVAFTDGQIGKVLAGAGLPAHEGAIRTGGAWTVYNLELDPKERNPIPANEAGPIIDQARIVVSRSDTIPAQPCLHKPYRN